MNIEVPEPLKRIGVTVAATVAAIQGAYASEPVRDLTGLELGTENRVLRDIGELFLQQDPIGDYLALQQDPSRGQDPYITRGADGFSTFLQHGNSNSIGAPMEKALDNVIFAGKQPYFVTQARFIAGSVERADTLGKDYIWAVSLSRDEASPLITGKPVTETAEFTFFNRKTGKTTRVPVSTYLTSSDTPDLEHHLGDIASVGGTRLLVAVPEYIGEGGETLSDTSPFRLKVLFLAPSGSTSKPEYVLPSDDLIASDESQNAWRFTQVKDNGGKTHPKLVLLGAATPTEKVLPDGAYVQEILSGAKAWIVVDPPESEADAEPKNYQFDMNTGALTEYTPPANKPDTARDPNSNKIGDLSLRVERQQGEMANVFLIGVEDPSLLQSHPKFSFPTKLPIGASSLEGAGEHAGTAAKLLPADSNGNIGLLKRTPEGALTYNGIKQLKIDDVLSAMTQLELRREATSNADSISKAALRFTKAHPDAFPQNPEDLKVYFDGTANLVSVFTLSDSPRTTFIFAKDPEDSNVFGYFKVGNRKIAARITGRSREILGE